MWQKVEKFKGAEYFRKALYIPNPNVTQLQVQQTVQRYLLHEEDVVNLMFSPHTV